MIHRFVIKLVMIVETTGLPEERSDEGPPSITLIGFRMFIIL